MRWRAGPPIGVPAVRAVRVGEVRVNGGGQAGGRGGMAVGEGKTKSAKRSQQLQLLSAVPPYRPTALPILDERLRGTKFVLLEPKSVLNSPRQTGVDFWSLNPYIGCEFGCTYCYARYAHRYTVERAHDAGKLTDEEFLEFRGPHGWEAFEKRVFVKEQLLVALERDLRDRKSTRLNSSHSQISYAVFCLKKKSGGRRRCCTTPTTSRRFRPGRWNLGPGRRTSR